MLNFQHLINAISDYTEQAGIDAALAVIQQIENKSIAQATADITINSTSYNLADITTDECSQLASALQKQKKLLEYPGYSSNLLALQKFKKDNNNFYQQHTEVINKRIVDLCVSTAYIEFRSSLRNPNESILEYITFLNNQILQNQSTYYSVIPNDLEGIDPKLGNLTEHYNLICSSSVKQLIALFKHVPGTAAYDAVEQFLNDIVNDNTGSTSITTLIDFLSKEDPDEDHIKKLLNLKTRETINKKDIAAIRERIAFFVAQKIVNQNDKLTVTIKTEEQKRGFIKSLFYRIKQGRLRLPDNFDNSIRSLFQLKSLQDLIEESKIEIKYDDQPLPDQKVFIPDNRRHLKRALKISDAISTAFTGSKFQYDHNIVGNVYQGQKRAAFDKEIYTRWFKELNDEKMFKKGFFHKDRLSIFPQNFSSKHEKRIMALIKIVSHSSSSPDTTLSALLSLPIETGLPVGQILELPVKQSDYVNLNDIQDNGGTHADTVKQLKQTCLDRLLDIATYRLQQSEHDFEIATREGSRMPLPHYFRQKLRRDSLKFAAFNKKYQECLVIWEKSSDATKENKDEKTKELFISFLTTFFPEVSLDNLGFNPEFLNIEELKKTQVWKNFTIELEKTRLREIEINLDDLKNLSREHLNYNFRFKGLGGLQNQKKQNQAKQLEKASIDINNFVEHNNVDSNNIRNIKEGIDDSIIDIRYIFLNGEETEKQIAGILRKELSDITTAKRKAILLKQKLESLKNNISSLSVPSSSLDLSIIRSINLYCVAKIKALLPKDLSEISKEDCNLLLQDLLDELDRYGEELSEYEKSPTKQDIKVALPILPYKYTSPELSNSKLISINQNLAALTNNTDKDKDPIALLVDSLKNIIVELATAESSDANKRCLLSALEELLRLTALHMKIEPYYYFSDQTAAYLYKFLESPEKLRYFLAVHGIQDLYNLKNIQELVENNLFVPSSQEMYKIEKIFTSEVTKNDIISSFNNINININIEDEPNPIILNIYEANQSQDPGTLKNLIEQIHNKNAAIFTTPLPLPPAGKYKEAICDTALNRAKTSRGYISSKSTVKNINLTAKYLLTKSEKDRSALDSPISLWPSTVAAITGIEKSPVKQKQWFRRETYPSSKDDTTDYGKLRNCAVDAFCFVLAEGLANATFSPKKTEEGEKKKRFANFKFSRRKAIKLTPEQAFETINRNQILEGLKSLPRDQLGLDPSLNSFAGMSDKKYNKFIQDFFGGVKDNKRERRAIIQLGVSAKLTFDSFKAEFQKHIQNKNAREQHDLLYNTIFIMLPEVFAKPPTQEQIEELRKDPKLASLVDAAATKNLMEKILNNPFLEHLFTAERLRLELLSFIEQNPDSEISIALLSLTDKSDTEAFKAVVHLLVPNLGEPRLTEEINKLKNLTNQTAIFKDLKFQLCKHAFKCALNKHDFNIHIHLRHLLKSKSNKEFMKLFKTLWNSGYLNTGKYKFEDFVNSIRKEEDYEELRKIAKDYYLNCIKMVAYQQEIKIDDLILENKDSVSPEKDLQDLSPKDFSPNQSYRFVKDDIERVFNNEDKNAIIKASQGPTGPDDQSNKLLENFNTLAEASIDFTAEGIEDIIPSAEKTKDDEFYEIRSLLNLACIYNKDNEKKYKKLVAYFKDQKREAFLHLESEAPILIRYAIIQALLFHAFEKFYQYDAENKEEKDNILNNELTKKNNFDYSPHRLLITQLKDLKLVDEDTAKILDKNIDAGLSLPVADKTASKDSEEKQKIVEKQEKIDQSVGMSLAVTSKLLDRITAYINKRKDVKNKQLKETSETQENDEDTFTGEIVTAASGMIPMMVDSKGQDVRSEIKEEDKELHYFKTVEEAMSSIQNLDKENRNLRDTHKVSLDFGPQVSVDDQNKLKQALQKTLQGSPANQQKIVEGQQPDGSHLGLQKR